MPTRQVLWAGRVPRSSRAACILTPGRPDAVLGSPSLTATLQTLSVSFGSSLAQGVIHTSSPLAGRPEAASLTVQIPKTQKAAIVESADAPLKIVNDHPVRQPKDLAPGECLVQLECSGVCHTDLHARKGDWPLKAKLPLIGGVGTVVAIGEHTQGSPVKLGDRVGIKWLAYSCLDCELCRKGLEQTICRLLGQPRHPIPANLDSYEAASILCAGVTVYRALKYSHTHIGDWVAIPAPAEDSATLPSSTPPPWAPRARRRGSTDTGAEKRELVKKLGAEAWVDFRESKDIVADIRAATDGQGPHAAIVTAANSSAYAQAVDYLRLGGNLMVVGLPRTRPSPRTSSSPSRRASASTAPTSGVCLWPLQEPPGRARGARYRESRKVKCFYETRGLDSLLETYESLEKGVIVGRIVLNMRE
ncbi:chaperonin 10-like protein [Fomitopsis serialis]|uniref:chaperonin 10-like protein n=1 Tax=Fomitopsis serialis TaxID=139415 RepID=UPI00200851E1|nr:chaperonin 10-like protein [Neoantrodia serialis]KAH9922457.1 chaperonin 10-like protein [Neoantrodia serialis]